MTVCAAGASSSSAVPPATDEQLRAALLRLVAASDVTVVTYKQLQQQLEAQFQVGQYWVACSSMFELHMQHCKGGWRGCCCSAHSLQQGSL
jgi:hypothetical protein